MCFWLRNNKLNKNIETDELLIRNDSNKIRTWIVLIQQHYKPSINQIINKMRKTQESLKDFVLILRTDYCWRYKEVCHQYTTTQENSWKVTTIDVNTRLRNQWLIWETLIKPRNSIEGRGGSEIKFWSWAYLTVNCISYRIRPVWFSKSKK